MLRRISLFTILSLYSIAFVSGCGEDGDDKNKAIGTWFYSKSNCDDDETTVEGATLEIQFKSNGDGMRTFTTDGCVVTNEFKWIVDGNKIVTAPIGTSCDPNSCELNLEIGGVDFNLDCPNNFEDVWQALEITLDGDLATESFRVQNLNCRNTYIRP